MVVSNHTHDMRNSLSTKGLSLSQAASISNMCYQRAVEISNVFNGLNNAAKTVKIGSDTYDTVVGKPLPANVSDLIKEKSLLHATQAFLMINIKAKDQLLLDLKVKRFTTELKEPITPEYSMVVPTAQVDEAWGWDQLTQDEYFEYIEAETYAAHIGKFIHKDSPLDKLRTELPTIKTLEWITVKDGERTPVKVVPHHTSEELLEVYEDLASEHRAREMRVNYFKAKVKNLVTEENARIARKNADEQNAENNINYKLMNDHTAAMQVFNGEILRERNEFEAKRQDDTKAAAALRISIDARFQETIDSYLKNLDPES